MARITIEIPTLAAPPLAASAPTDAPPLPIRHSPYYFSHGGPPMDGSRRARGRREFVASALYAVEPSGSDGLERSWQLRHAAGAGDPSQ